MLSKCQKKGDFCQFWNIDDSFCRLYDRLLMILCCISFLCGFCTNSVEYFERSIKNIIFMRFFKDFVIIR